MTAAIQWSVPILVGGALIFVAEFLAGPLDNWGRPAWAFCSPSGSGWIGLDLWQGVAAT